MMDMIENAAEQAAIRPQERTDGLVLPLDEGDASVSGTNDLHQCPYCIKSFLRSLNLKKHIRLKHPGMCIQGISLGISFHQKHYETMYI